MEDDFASASSSYERPAEFDQDFAVANSSSSASVVCNNDENPASLGLSNSHPIARAVNVEEDLSEFNPSDDLMELSKITERVCGPPSHDGEDAPDEPDQPAEREEDDQLLQPGDKREDNLHLVLAMNEAMTELIGVVITKVEAALDANKKKQKTLMHRRAQLRDDNMRRKVPVNMFLPPYFKDSFGMCPPQNAEMRRKLENMVYDPLLKEDRKWSKEELKKLREAVRNSLVEARLINVYAQRELLLEKKKRAGVDTTQEERDEWETKIRALNRKILHDQTLSDDVILVGNYEAVDWARIAISAFKGTRSPMQLKLKWCNEQCPQVNNGPWTATELRQLVKHVREDFISWAVVAERLGTRRTAWACFEKYKGELDNNVIKREWTVEEDERLIKLVDSLQLNGTIQWDKVTYHMPGRTRQQCRCRYTRTLDRSVRHGRWTDEEDLLLMCAIGRYGAKDWAKVARGVPGRSDGQCRERWVNVLDRANRNQEWTMEEDEKLLYGVNIFGKGQWARVATLLDGRSPRSCKNRFRSLMTTKMRLCAAQLSKIREAQQKGILKHAILRCESKKNKVYSNFNAIIGGDDENGEELSRRAKQLRKSSVEEVRHGRVSLEVRRVVEQNMREMEVGTGKDLNVDELILGGADNTIDQSGMSALLLHGGPEAAEEQAEENEEMDELPSLPIPDREWVDVNFDDQVDEEGRRRRLTDALCQVVRKQDQMMAVREVEANSCAVSERIVHEKLRQLVEEGVESRVNRMMEQKEKDGARADSPSAVSQTEQADSLTGGEINSLPGKQMLPSEQLAVEMGSAKSVEATTMTPVACTTHAAALLAVSCPRLKTIASSLSAVFTEPSLADIPDVTVSLLSDRRFVQFKEQMRTLLSQPLELLHSIETPQQMEARLVAEMTEAERCLLQKEDDARDGGSAPPTSSLHQPLSTRKTKRSVRSLRSDSTPDNEADTAAGGEATAGTPLTTQKTKKLGTKKGKKAMEGSEPKAHGSGGAENGLKEEPEEDEGKCVMNGDEHTSEEDEAGPSGEGARKRKTRSKRKAGGADGGKSAKKRRH